jgi:hypothetical protein
MYAVCLTLDGMQQQQHEQIQSSKGNNTQGNEINTHVVEANCTKYNKVAQLTSHPFLVSVTPDISQSVKLRLLVQMIQQCIQRQEKLIVASQFVTMY